MIPKKNVGQLASLPGKYDRLMTRKISARVFKQVVVIILCQVWAFPLEISLCSVHISALWVVAKRFSSCGAGSQLEECNLELKGPHGSLPFLLP